jgi:hypothetical protein
LFVLLILVELLTITVLKVIFFNFFNLSLLWSRIKYIWILLIADNCWSIIKIIVIIKTKTKLVAKKVRDIAEILLKVALNTINQTTFKERKIQLKTCNNDAKNVYYMIFDCSRLCMRDITKPRAIKDRILITLLHDFLWVREC